MFAAALLLSLLGSVSPAGQAEATVSNPPLVILVDVRHDLALGRAALSLAFACRDVRPVKILAHAQILFNAQGRFDWVFPDGERQSRLAGADLYSALSRSFQEAGFGGDVVFMGTYLPLRAYSAQGQTTPLANVEFSEPQYPSYRFKRSLEDLRESGATFHAVAFPVKFRWLPEEGMTLLARESGGSIWKAGTQRELPAEVIEQLCGR